MDELRIVSTDRFDRSIIIGFSDGRSGRFSAELLYTMLSQSEELFEPATPGDFDEPDGSAVTSSREHVSFDEMEPATAEFKAD